MPQFESIAGDVNVAEASPNIMLLKKEPRSPLPEPPTEAIVKEKTPDRVTT